jgi:hypothetical protein
VSRQGRRGDHGSHSAKCELWEDSYELRVGREGEMIVDHVAPSMNCGRIVMNCGSGGKERR